jgi:predicted ATPase/DNA-binding SARP family transcriptional activator
MVPRLILQFLGLPHVLLDDRPISTDRRKAIALLAYLAVNDIGRPRQKYSRESLSALLWPDYDQAKAFSNLRTILWELRQAIGESWLIADRESVQLNPDAEIDLDVARFQDLLFQSRQHSDPALRIPLLSDAVKLYRDHFLTGFSLKDAPNFNEWAFAESEELRRKLTDTLTTLSEDHCALGQADRASFYARRLVALDPLNESSHRQLMEVYWQAGQHSAALKQYQTYEQILRKELNLDPQPETRALYKKILKGEMKPVRVEKQIETVSPKNNLPLQLTTFIGREKVLDEIMNLIAKNRLVTLTGAGGIGKTRLSIQAASALLHDFPNGTWLVELAPLSDAALVPQGIVNTLGLIEQAGRPPQTILTDFLQEKKSLLILDNCEHLIQACAQLVETLLHACPDLHILATSREALDISGETVYLVPVLSTPDALPSTRDTLSQYEAVQLFVERAQSAMHNFSLTQDNAAAIAQVCHLLDGIPLALELAAARVKLLRVEEITARLDDRFRLLTSGTRTALPRHQTLQALIDWSHNLLAEPERMLLRRLSAFSGGWTFEAVENVCVDAGQGDILSQDVLNLITQLVNKSLVIAERKQGQETRYRMLETIRQYAHDKLWAAGEGEMMRQRHLAYFVELAERAEPNLRAFDMVMWLDRLEAEHDNIRAALDWALENDVEAHLRLASALLWFWHIRGHKNEGVDWLERGLSIEAAERGDQPPTPSRAMIRGKALNASGFLIAMGVDDRKAASRLEESLALFQGLGPAGKQGMAYALLRLGETSGLDNRAENMIEQSLTLFQEIGDKFGTAECLMLLADGSDDHKQASIFAEEQLALRREIGDHDGVAMALRSLSSLAFWQDDYQKAFTLNEESIAILREVRNKWAIGFTLPRCGDICFWQGDYEQAMEIYQEALTLAQEIGDEVFRARNIYSLGVIALLRGEHTRAAQMITDSLAVLRHVDDWQVAGLLHTLGDIALAQGDDKRAVQRYEAELASSHETQFKPATIFAIVGMGKVAWTNGDYEVATKRFEEVLRMCQESGERPAMFHAFYGLGWIAQSQGDYAGASICYARMLEIQRQRIKPLFRLIWLKSYACIIAYPLAAFAVLAAAQKQMQRATRLLGAAENSYAPIRFEMSAKERAEHDQAIASARAALGEEAFAKAWAEGQAMTLEEAVAYALEDDT